MAFEAKLAKLESLVSRMESGDMDLDAMIASFEEGRALLDACRKELDSIRLRIEKVTAAGAVEEVKIVANAQGESDVDL